MAKAVLTLLLGSALLIAACGPFVPCSGRVGSETVDPRGGACSVHCECNNQAYAGRCEGGHCVGKPREACTSPGAERLCAADGAGSACKLGKQICKPDYLESLKWGDCEGPRPSPNEAGALMCFDGLDNDCDGRSDLGDEDCAEYCRPGDEKPCYSGPAGSRKIGLCRDGVRSCGANRKWSAPCVGEVLPTKESCEGKDNDCDGTVDEGCGCDPVGSTRECFGGPAGTAGVGVCAKGVQECRAAGWGACVGEIRPGAETCNGKDDDCDGSVDEDVGESSCVVPGAKGACAIGATKCERGSSTCAGPVPSTEVCDKLDNDCDGQVDESYVCKEVILNAGAFSMGSQKKEPGREPDEWPVHKALLTRSFAKWKHEVTQGTFQAVMGYNPSYFKCGTDCPVEQVSWNEAAAFCNRLSRQTGLQECYDCSGSAKATSCILRRQYSGTAYRNYYGCPGYRLPSEAEWEFAY